MNRFSCIASALLGGSSAMGCGGTPTAQGQATVVEVAIAPVSSMDSSPEARAAATASIPSTARVGSPAPAPEARDDDAVLMEMLGGSTSAAAPASGLTLQGPSSNAGSMGIGSLGGGGASASTAPPRGPFSQVTATGSVTGTVDGFEQVVAGMRAGFRRCHNKWLTHDPTAVGSITLRAQLDASGAVTSVTVTRAAPKLGDAVACAQARVGAAQFATPAHGKASISIAIDFALQP